MDGEEGKEHVEGNAQPLYIDDESRLRAGWLDRNPGFLLPWSVSRSRSLMNFPFHDGDLR